MLLLQSPFKGRISVFGSSLLLEFFLGGALLFFWGGGTTSAYAQDRLVVIVHEKNKEILSHEQIQGIFLRKQKYWSNDQPIAPILPSKRHLHRSLFLKNVLKMTEGDFFRFWANQKNTKGEISPIETHSERFVLMFVSKNSNAIGCISSEFISKELHPLIRIVRSFP